MWRAMVRRKGKPPQTRSFARKIDAEKWVHSVEAQLDKGKHVAFASLTARQLFEKYRDEVSVTKGGARWERLRIDLILKQAKFANKNYGLVSSLDIQEWKDARLKEVSRASVNRELNVISGIYTHAAKEWLLPLDGNPVHQVKRPPKTKPRKRRVTQEEIALVSKVLVSSRKFTTKWYTPYVFEFAVETAMRLGEIAELTWCDVNLDEHWVFVGKSKNGDERSVPLTARAEEILHLVSGTEGKVFPVNTGTVGVYFRNAAEKAGITDLHFHDSRHEAITRLSKVLNVMELAQAVGHRDLKSLMVYYNPTGRELAQAVRGNSSAPGSRYGHRRPTTGLSESQAAASGESVQDTA